MFWFKTGFSQDFDRPCQLQIPTDLRPTRMWPPFETLSGLLSEGEGEGRRDFVQVWEKELALSSSAPCLRDQTAQRAVVQEPRPLIWQVHTHFQVAESHLELWGPLLSLHSFVFLPEDGGELARETKPGFPFNPSPCGTPPGWALSGDGQSHGIQLGRGPRGDGT